MRIMLFAAGGDIGGGKTHILSIAKELASQNALKLVSFRRGVLSSEAREMGIDTVDMNSELGTYRALKLALKQVEIFCPDVIHCHGAKANMLGVIVKKLKGIPVMTTVHSDPKLDYLGMPLKQYTYGLINEYALRHMDYYVAVANRMQEILIERGFDPQAIFTVFNGLDFSEAKEEARPYKAEDEIIKIGIAARLTPIKDIGTVIRAFAIAYKQNNKLRLSIAGTGEDVKSLKSLAKELGVDEVTTFEGWISDIKKYFSEIDINVLASLSETFPYSLLEGAYEHCPAIATNVGGIPSLIEHQVSGFLFEPGDIVKFSEYILVLAQDQALRRRLAENLFYKASEEFSLDRMQHDQQRIYETVVRRSTAKGRNGAILCGAYGKGNAGDEAILRAILTQIREIDEDMPFWVMSRNPMGTKKKEKVRSFFIFNVPAFLANLRKAKLFVNGGGSLIQDITSSRSLYFYLFTLWAAKWSGCKIIMYGCGIGPISGSGNRKIAGFVLNRTADIITLRDSVSFALLSELGVNRPEIILAADPTLNLSYANNEAIEKAFTLEGIPSGLRKIGFCLRPWASFAHPEYMATAAKYAFEKYGLTPIFLPIETPKDQAISEELSSMLDIPNYVCRHQHPVGDLIGMLGAMDMVLGMRLHSLIFATAGGAPVLGISYDVKVDSFIKDIGSTACIPLESLSEKVLCDHIDAIFSAGKVAGVSTKKRLQAMELANGEAARRLLAAESKAI
ncbi:MAG: polysaccharide pyruvyl transferase CsaB [Clostridia bacterium]|nr:polysaccharide pyruvyl transferase CsaB [Clostridia bacterium]